MKELYYCQKCSKLYQRQPKYKNDKLRPEQEIRKRIKTLTEDQKVDLTFEQLKALYKLHFKEDYKEDKPDVILRTFQGFRRMQLLSSIETLKWIVYEPSILDKSKRKQKNS